MLDLSLHETRVIGALLEKEVTTPDQYPLSLNALTNACNQKSNREPVMSLEESEVQVLVDSLTAKNLIAEVIFGGRVPKYKHRFCNTEFSQLHLNPREFAIICVLFLRGPQTPGELRTRTNRMCEFANVAEVESALDRLMSREDGHLVVRLEREPGKRESRYAHLFSGEVDVALLAAQSAAQVPVSLAGGGSAGIASQEGRIAELEQQVEAMQLQIDELKAQWDSLNS